ncbi:MAG: hypothetical protein RL642_580 [Bacteroidota bacterium]
MRLCRLLLFNFFLLVFFTAKGEQQIDWYSQDTLLKNGVYKSYGFVDGIKRFGIAFENKNNQPTTYFLKINNPHLNHIYVLNKTGDTLYTTGDKFRFSSRPIYFWEYVFPLTIPASSRDSVTVYLDKIGETLSFHALLISDKDYPKLHDGHLYFYSTFLSVTLFLLGGFIFLGFYKKERKHFLFAGFIFVSAGWALNERGIFFQYIWPDNIALQERLDTFYATPSLGLLLFILFFNETYKNLIGKKIKALLAFFLLFLFIRTILIFFYPALSENLILKSYTLRISNSIVIFMILFFIFNLLKWGVNRILFLDTLGFVVYFAYLLKLALRQINLDFVLTERFHGFAYPLMQTLTIGIFSVSNYLKHRTDRKRKLELENEAYLQREKEIAEKIIAVQENERENIGRNIHDQVGGLLAAAKIKLQTLKLKTNDHHINDEIEKVITVINTSSEEIYHVIDELVPPVIIGKDLRSIIYSRVEILELNNKINFKIDIPPIVLDEKLTLKIYRIISELITNSIKHAQCKNISIQFQKKNDNFSLDYIDDGIGIDKNSKRNHGINNIESRVKFVNGTIDLFSIPGKTHYSIQIPITENEK